MPQTKEEIKLDLYQKLAEAENEIKNGAELLDGKQVFLELRKKYQDFI
ncbi:hypothetical protein DFR79_11849 [Halanaerobium saccharolyticum]|uniref:Uncharacterized protein n=1 Tax=Halanaerobium saccharolyticum TaxID=43595 RepID=A0A4R6LKG6_9FIRM|nr:hypothetical protein [Halanaerobium saccharolyticum]TDO85283.1 hypothetical protein DFR79_11849 [Halanaerobium saccharolyticum]